MFIICHCGAHITDSTDFQTWKARFIPDAYSERYPDALELAAPLRDPGRFLNAARPYFREMWQCCDCGRLWLEGEPSDEGQGRTLHCFAPETSATSKTILAPLPEDEESIQWTLDRIKGQR